MLYLPGSQRFSERTHRRKIGKDVKRRAYQSISDGHGAVRLFPSHFDWRRLRPGVTFRYGAMAYSGKDLRSVGKSPSQARSYPVPRRGSGYFGP